MARTKAEQDRRSVRRARRHQLWIALASLAVIAAGVVGYLAFQAVATQPGVPVASQGNRHISTPSTQHVPYSTDPPTSGPHLPYIAPWGTHTTPIPKELQVHNLEDGGVMVQYNCDCPELVAELKRIVNRYGKQVILAPYPGMKGKIALTAWGRIDQFDEFDEKRIVRFIDAYRGIDHHPR
jgi:hypothetical protein